MTARASAQFAQPPAPRPVTERLRTSLAAQLAAMRGVPPEHLPPALLDVAVEPVELPRGAQAFVVRPADWEQLRHEEGGDGRPVPYWARLWPSGRSLAAALAAAPPRPGANVLELGCGLGLPSVVAARAGANVLATDSAADAVAFAAHTLALNETVADVAHVGWDDALAERGPFDLVLASDVLYTLANVAALQRVIGELVAPWGELRLADPGRAGARDFLAGARSRFHLRTVRDGEVNLHTLRWR